LSHKVEKEDEGGEET